MWGSFAKIYIVNIDNIASNCLKYSVFIIQATTITCADINAKVKFSNFV